MVIITITNVIAKATDERITATRGKIQVSVKTLSPSLLLFKLSSFSSLKLRLSILTSLSAIFLAIEFSVSTDFVLLMLAGFSKDLACLSFFPDFVLLMLAGFSRDFDCLALSNRGKYASLVVVMPSLKKIF